jgi:hypothetical protein
MINDLKLRADWECRIGFVLEENLYKDYIALGVNDYSAEFATGGFKRKGDFASLRLGKSLNGSIIFKAVEAYIRNKTLRKIP